MTLRGGGGGGGGGGEERVCKSCDNVLASSWNHSSSQFKKKIIVANLENIAVIEAH